MSIQMKALVEKNDELTKDLKELIRKTEMREEQQGFHHERLNQLEQTYATHILRSGKIVDNKIGIDTNLPYEFVQDQEDQGEQYKERNDGGIQAKSQEKIEEETARKEEKKKATERGKEKESEVALPYPPPIE